MFLFLAVVAGLGTASAYRVCCTRSGTRPVLSSRLSNSVYKWNYNAAAIGSHLLIRCQNHDANSSSPFATTPSVLALTSIDEPKVGEDNVVFSSAQDPYADYGTEDPRIVFDAAKGAYLMTYTAAHTLPDKNIVAKLSLATSRNLQTWNVVGPMLPNISYSKSGAIVLGAPNRMIFGDSSLVPGLQLAEETKSGWVVQEGIYLAVRNSSFFDSHLVEAGPPPLPLSDGTLFFIYNSAKSGVPSVKPGYSLQYNIGWAILNATDLSILERSSKPILSPKLDWETGTNGELDLTPNVVFCNGMVPGSVPNEFVLFYGGADSVTGVAKVKVAVA